MLVKKKINKITNYFIIVHQKIYINSTVEVFYNYYLKKGKKFHLTEIELEEDLQILRGLTKNIVKF